MVGMDTLSDEVLAKLYRDRRTLTTEYYDELLRRGYSVYRNGTPYTALSVPTNELRIMKTITTTKEL